METTPVRAASTILIVRERDGLEVLMVKRNAEIDFFSGAMMFPGGKVEARDGDPRWAAHARGWRDVAADERAPRIAALREAFEECGLLAAAGPVAAPRDRASEEDLGAARARVESGATGFLDVLGARGMRLDLSRLTLFSRWLTPPITARRFDTWFYLVAAPEDQSAAVDGREVIETEWVAPAEALRRAAAGERRILFPTRMTLRLLAASPTLAHAVAACANRSREPITPVIDMRAGQRYLRLLPEHGHGEVEELLETGPAAPNAPSR